MTDEMKKRLASFILSRMLMIATNGGLSLLWLDMAQGRVMFKLDPSSEQVNELLANVKVLHKFLKNG